MFQNFCRDLPAVFAVIHPVQQQEFINGVIQICVFYCLIEKLFAGGIFQAASGVGDILCTIGNISVSGFESGHIKICIFSPDRVTAAAVVFRAIRCDRAVCSCSCDCPAAGIDRLCKKPVPGNDKKDDSDDKSDDPTDQCGNCFFIHF